MAVIEQLRQRGSTSRTAVGQSIRQELSLFLSTRPRLFYPVMRVRRAYAEVLLTGDTEIVIEGYPRSANTFATVAFQLAQGRAVAIGRHTHAAAQVIEAVRRRVPTIVLLRSPTDAITSLVVRNPEISVELALRRYRVFYSHVAPYRKGFVVASFDTVVSDYAKIIGQINEKFGVAFKLFEHCPDNLNKVFHTIEDMSRRNYGGVLSETHVARPSAIRSENKTALSGVFERPRCVELLRQCDALYDYFSGPSPD